MIPAGVCHFNVNASTAQALELSTRLDLVSAGLHEFLDDADLICCLQADCSGGASWGVIVDEGS